MIRKWLKINTCFFEILKNTTGTNGLEKKWSQDYARQYLSCCTFGDAFPCSRAVASASAGHVGHVGYVGHASLGPKPFHVFGDPMEKGDGEKDDEGEEEGEAVVETPARTELFEVKGPGGSGFLIEVRARDLEEVRAALVRLKGEHFRFDRTILEWFAMKCILAGERAGEDGPRLAKVHAISSGAEEVYRGDGKYFFVSSVDKTMRAKRILERLGYKISDILYRFQPKEKISLDKRVRELCYGFVQAVEQLPKVISVTHNV